MRTDAELTLYQAEWCPFSSAVREALTELGINFVARQVEPWPSDRNDLRQLAGTDQTPVLQTEDGRLFRGTRESDAVGQLIEYFRGTAELEAATGSPEEAEIVDVPGASRYELRLGGRLIGLAAYRRRDGRIAFTHTEVDESCEGRGFGTRLAAAAVEDAARQGLEVVPLCPFIAHYIERHPEFEQLVGSGYRDR